MKNRILLLAAATTMGLTACQNNNQEGTFTQEQLDSIVQFRIDSTNNALRLENDSIINDKAVESATESASPAAKKSPAKANTTTTPSSSPKTVPTEEQGTISPAPKPRTNADIEADKKAARFGDEEAKARLKQDEANKKAARFGDQEAKEKVEQVEADKKADRFRK